ncbi:hypothetical protein Poli38472_007394 [Pythium oligandrum]|uniref:Chromo domain-containing protein n=1 Tax=Pythium oligandrum TaxID=41045 RepID=A0A8K1CS42_PYTOL|nr:hypothetical protein Poli38472_007394 [Pythium oligandrum]|eukprot:TMW67722.1 hypothetical protein Poli38472_007394 [Pythium oligandrum]
MARFSETESWLREFDIIRAGNPAEVREFLHYVPLDSLSRSEQIALLQSVLWDAGYSFLNLVPASERNAPRLARFSPPLAPEPAPSPYVSVPIRSAPAAHRAFPVSSTQVDFQPTSAASAPVAVSTMPAMSTFPTPHYGMGRPFIPTSSIMPFYGDEGLGDRRDWIEHFLYHASSGAWTQPEMCRYMGIYLKGAAKHWYKQLGEVRRSWPSLEKVFRREFCTASESDNARFHFMKQTRNETARQYFWRLQAAARDADIVPDSRKELERFVNRYTRSLTDKSCGNIGEGIECLLGMDFMISAGVRLSAYEGTVKLPDEEKIPLVSAGFRPKLPERITIWTQDDLYIGPGLSTSIPIVYGRGRSDMVLWVYRGEDWLPKVVKNKFGVHDQEIPLVEYAKRFVDERKKLVELARKNLIAAQERQKQYYDKKRREVEFAEGDLVLLDTKNLPLRVAAEGAEEKKSKLAARRIGPFRIIKMINDNVAKLELPANLSRLHPTFNVELLTHYVPSPDKFETRPTSKAAPIIIDEETGEKTYVIEKLLEFRQVRRRREWLIKWEGYPEHECTWEPEKDLKHVSHWADLVEDFENRQREVKSGGMS